jgi:hypothetical protein
MCSFFLLKKSTLSKVEDKIVKHKWPVMNATNPGTPPYGFNVSLDRKVWTPIPEMLDALERAKDLLAGGTTTRECADWLSEHTGKKISHQGFIKRIKRDNKFYKGWSKVQPEEITQWITSTEDYGDGKLRYPEEKRNAKPQGNGRSKKAALLKGRTDEERAIIKTSHTLTEAKRVVSKSTNRLKTLVKETGTEEAKDLVPPEILSEITTEEIIQRAIEKSALVPAFKPNPGPQTSFLASTEDVIFYGGAKGGGKSYALIADPVRYFGHPNFKALILRRSMPELRDMISHTEKMYPKAYPGAVYLSTQKIWKFPSGATLEFGFCETEDDAERYRGRSFNWVGVDELPQYSHRGPFDAVMSCVRSVDPELPAQLRCTGNPGNIGSYWVKELFIDPAPANTRFYKTAIIEDPRTGEEREVRKSFKYIPATVYDNPYYMQDDSYIATLAMLPEVKRKQMLEGNWDIVEGGAFEEFDRSTHVVKPFEIPGNWYTFRAADWGFSTPFCVLWMAVDFDDNMYVFKEWYDKGIYDDTWAETIVKKEDECNIHSSHAVVDGSISTSRGSRAPDSLEVINKIMARNRKVKFKKADRSPGSRKEGKLAVHRMLALKETGRRLPSGEKEHGPSLFIFEDCVNLIRTLPMLLTDKNDPEVVQKKNADDHPYDALQYGIRSHKSNARRRFKNIQTINPSVRKHSIQQ